MVERRAMKTIPLAVRERIVKCYDRQQATREQVAQYFGVSLGLVKKLLQQRRRTGDLSPLHHRAGRKPIILQSHREQLQALLKQKSDMTLAELRTAIKLHCSLPAIYYVLAELGLTYKKRHSAPANKTGPTLRRHALNGKNRYRRGI